MDIDSNDLWAIDQHMAELDGTANSWLNQISHNRIMGAADEVKLTFDVIGQLQEEFQNLPEEARYQALLAAHARALVRWSKEAL